MTRKSSKRQMQARSGRSSRAKSKKTRKSKSARRQLRFAFGARRQEIVGVLFIMLSAVSLPALLGVTTGTLIDAWRNVLTGLFGLGSYPVAVMFALGGVLLIRHAQGVRLQRRWLRIVGLESAFFAALAATHAAVSGVDPWALIAQGGGGGVIGWGLSILVIDAIGRPFAVLLFTVVTFVGVTFAFQIDWGAIIERGGDALYRLRDWASSAPIFETDDSSDDVDQPESVSALTSTQAVVASQTPRTSVASMSSMDDVPLVEPRQANPPPGYVGTTHGSTPESVPVQVKQIELPLHGIKRSEIVPELPALDLLEDYSSQAIAQQEAEAKAKTIEETLRHFGLEGSVVDINTGPAVTQFGLEPGYIERATSDGGTRQQKVRVGQITALANDLALALSASSLRIEAPVPGKGYIGIEVPNKQVSLVSLRGVMDSDTFVSKNSMLKIALGRDVGGRPMVADLASMPHLLIAGTTGSGKSVLISALTLCLTYVNTPKDLRLVLIDPKMVELVRFNGLPHLLGKVEVESDRILGVLRWATHEMDDRYKRFSEVAARSLADYNAKMKERGEESLPMIVIMIDELADLMLSMPVETERLICRLAQMARATGIHLVIATQRPSTDVVTGLIKANFPARIAFAVASSIDSRVILDSVGAESLIGRGDMLFQSPDAGYPVRVQGCFVSDSDVENMVAFWHEQYKDAEPEPAPWEPSMSQLIKLGSGKSSAGGARVSDEEELLQTAIALVRQQKGASASLLQRKLRIGYPKAARLIDEMFDRGLIGPPVEAGRLRDVLPPKQGG